MIPKMTLNNIKFNLISNNVEGLQISKKYLKLFEDFKDKIFPNGIVFLREKSSIRENEIQWKNNFRGNFCFSHGRSNSCSHCLLRYKTFHCEEENRI